MDTPDIKKRIAVDFGKDSMKASEILKAAISKNKQNNIIQQRFLYKGI